MSRFISFNQVRANTVTDDKELLAKAYAEIARLKMLLRQALRTGDKGSEGIRKSSDKSDVRNDGEDSYRINRSRSSGNSFNSVAQSDAATTYYASGKKTSGENNSATLILFEDNEKLRTENKKMRHALEWSIKLARKKRSSSTDFDTAPVDEIETYRHILNSIDRTPVTAISPYVGYNHHNNSSSKKDKSQREDVLQRALSGLKSTPVQKGKTISRFTSPLLTKIASSDFMKKKVRGASISLPAVYKSQKELNYLEYIKSPNRTGKLPPRGT